MSEQVFNFPNFYDREIDATSQVAGPVGIPAGVIGAAIKGPAFIPYTVGSFADFTTKFGGLNSKIMAPYAVQAFLGNSNALTFVKVLGAGANTTSEDIYNTSAKGIVKNAGFAVSGTVGSPGIGSVQFLVARHTVTADEPAGFPLFSNNSSFSLTASSMPLVRGVVFSADGARMLISADTLANAKTDDVATYATPSGGSEPIFKVMISSSLGLVFGNDDGNVGVRIMSASFNPSSDLYIGKILNTDPTKFLTEQHYLYTDYAVDDEVATIATTADAVMIASGSSNSTSTGGLTGAANPFLNLFGRFDTRYTNPKSPIFISQPFGGSEFDLFHFESIDDGAYGNTQVKISIQNIVASTNGEFPYGTFAVVIRQFSDTDLNPVVLEQFTDLTLNPDDEKYIAKIIGDATARYFFDAETVEDRRILKVGNYPNKSKYIRVVMNEQVEQKKVPVRCLPFGFHGFNVLNTNPTFTDSVPVIGSQRLAGISGSSYGTGSLGAIIPPVPYRYKVTRGFGAQEITDSRFYWGVKFERNNNNVENVNINGEANKFLTSLSKFHGIEKLDVLVTGSSKDTFNNNKFTLARVALNGVTSVASVVGTADKNMKNAKYVRNGVVNSSDYKIAGNITFATLLQGEGESPITYNKFSKYAKFTTMLQGGFDGVNILDEHAVRFDDISTAAVGGGADVSFVSPGFATNQNGASLLNNQINSYNVATNIITDPIASNINVLAVPGQREPLLTNYISAAVANYGLALYVMDIPNYNSAEDRIFDGAVPNSASYIDVSNTADKFDSRGLNNTFVAAYFPDVIITDTSANKKVAVPASVATLAAIAYNDKVAYPWFAPAGFNRAALNFVSMARTRVNQTEREKLYRVRINPIVKFPNEGYVIFAQKTLDASHSALENINVQRMLMSIQRQVIDIGNRIIWQQLSTSLYKDFVGQVSPVLGSVQARGGLKAYKIVCDATNNTDLDRENNRMNAKIYVLPVKAVEFIAVDFIITRAGTTMG
jgi:hypothetical protein